MYTKKHDIKIGWKKSNRKIKGKLPAIGFARVLLISAVSMRLQFLK